MMPIVSKSHAGQRQGLRLWLRWAGHALVSLGLLFVGYVALILVQAKLYDSEARYYADRPSAQNHALPAAQSDISLPESSLIEGEILGRVEIRRLGVSTALLQGTSSRTLRHGVGHIPGTAIPGQPGNIGIAGHRDTFFRALKDIHEGDEIEVRAGSVSTRYLVDWTRVVRPDDNSSLDPTRESALTLVTCYPFYFIGAAPKRFVVRAHKLPTSPESTQAGSPVPAAGLTALLPGETQ